MKFEATNLFHIPVHRITLSTLLAYVAGNVERHRRTVLLPINIHILVGALSVPDRASLYTKTPVVVFADGVPIVWLSRLTKSPLPSRVSGTDLVDALLRSDFRIFLLGSTPGILASMVRRYNNGHKNPIVGTYSPPHAATWSDAENRAIRTAIRQSRADIVLVGVGFPKQERWIMEHMRSLSATVYAGVGSAFDILSGATPRAPRILQFLGLEWVWRIALEPKRLLIRYLADMLLFGRLVIRRGRALLCDNRLVQTGACIIMLVTLLAMIVAGTRNGAATHRSDDARTGVYRSHLLRSPRWWRVTTDGTLTSAPVIHEGRVYVSSWESGSLFSLDEKSGRVLWKFTAGADLPFSPSVLNGTVYIGSVDGHLYALKATDGSLLWRFAAQNRIAITSHPYVYGNSIYISSRDHTLYAIYPDSGKKRWHFTSGGMIESSPVGFKGSLFFGSFDGKLYKISAKNGKKVWEFATKGPILSSPAIVNGTVYIGSQDGFLYAVDAQTKRLAWKTKLNGPIDATPSLSGNTVFVATRSDSIYAVDRNNGTVLWKKSVSTGPHAGFAVDGRLAYFGSQDGILYALDARAGNEKWRYDTGRPITAAPSIAGKSVYVTSDRYVYVLNKRTGYAYSRVASFTLQDPPKTSPLFSPMEFVISHNDNVYENPWYEASISAEFISPSNKRVVVDGFYYDRNVWRVRFSPNEVGQWRWAITNRPTPSSAETKQGEFVVKPSPDAGFLRISQVNPKQFTTDNGRRFIPIGIGDSLLDKNMNSYPLDDFSSDDQHRNLSVGDYARIYGKGGAGFNLFRWSVDNVSFPMWETQYNYAATKGRRWDTYPVRYGLWGDELVQTMRREGFHIWLTLWGFHPHVGKEENTRLVYDQPSIEGYLRYMVARYGAYVDVWELSNEAVVTTEWASHVAELLKSLDPYHHPVTISYERPDIRGIDITSPHWYESEDLSRSDLATIAKIRSYQRWPKPIVFGEQGNQFRNWDEESGTRMRVRTWTALFQDASLIFWNTSGTRDYTHARNANIYLGPQERSFIRAYQDIAQQITAETTATDIVSHNPSVRSYGMSGEDQMLVYAFHFDSPENTTTTTLSFLVPRAGTMEWIDPSNGSVVARSETSGGYVTVLTPAFDTDILLRIRFNK